MSSNTRSRMSFRGKRNAILASAPQDVLGEYIESLLSQGLLAVESPPRMAQMGDCISPGLARIDSVARLRAFGTFKVLQVKLKSIQLAVPLLYVDAVHRHVSRLTATPDEGAWVHGMVPLRGRQLQVIALDLLLSMQDNAPSPEIPEKPRLMVVIGGLRYGLACLELMDVVTLNADDIKWREPDRGTEFCAGVLKSRQVTVLDVPALLAWLENAGSLRSLDTGHNMAHDLHQSTH